MITDRLLIDLHVIEAAIAGRGFGQGAEGIDDLAARAVIQGQRSAASRYSLM